MFFYLFLFCVGLGVTIGLILDKKNREFYKHTLSRLGYSLLYIIPIITLVISIFSILYYVGLSPQLSLDNCIILSGKTFFSLSYSNEHSLGGIYKSCASIEHLLYDILSIILIGILLDKINEETINNKWKPIENMGYYELKRESQLLRDNLVIILFRSIPNEIKDSDSNVDGSDPIDNLHNKTIEDSEVRNIDSFKVKKSLKSYDVEKLLESSSTKISLLQVKYQNYIEPDITTKIIEIQNYLSSATQNLRIYNKYNKPSSDQSSDQLRDQLLELLREQMMDLFIENSLHAAKISVKIVEQLNNIDCCQNVEKDNELKN